MYKTYHVSKASAKAADVARGETILSPSFLLSHQTLTIHLGLAHDLSGMYSMDQNDLGRAKIILKEDTNHILTGRLLQRLLI